VAYKEEDAHNKKEKWKHSYKTHFPELHLYLKHANAFLSGWFK